MPKTKTKKKPAGRDPRGWVKGSTFRLEPGVLAELDFLAAHLSRTTGVRHTRTDAIRAAATRTASAVRSEKKNLE